MKRRFILMSILLSGAIYGVYAFKFTEKGEAYSGIAGNILAAIFAAFLAWVAWVEWGKVSRTSSADFIHKLTSDFFTPDTKVILGLIECNALEFVDQADGQTYFRVNEEVLVNCHLPEELLKRLTKNKFYATWEIDYCLLNPLEDVGMLERKGIVEFKMVYSGFSYYLDKALNYKAIKSYIDWMHEDKEQSQSEDNIFYGHARYIMKKCNEYDRVTDKSCAPCKLFWWVKREFFGIEPK